MHKEETLNSKAISEKIVDILDRKKASDISLIPVGDKTTLAEYFILASGQSTTQVKALADEVLYRLKQDENLASLGEEGREGGNWILLDFGGVIVHVFSKSQRSFYGLDEFWEQKPAEGISEIDPHAQV